MIHLQILQSLRMGIDLISTNYSECLCKAGRALSVRLPGDAAIVAEFASNTETVSADNAGNSKVKNFHAQDSKEKNFHAKMSK